MNISFGLIDDNFVLQWYIYIIVESLKIVKIKKHQFIPKSFIIKLLEKINAACRQKK